MPVPDEPIHLAHKPVQFGLLEPDCSTACASSSIPRFLQHLIGNDFPVCTLIAFSGRIGRAARRGNWFKIAAFSQDTFIVEISQWQVKNAVKKISPEES